LLKSYRDTNYTLNATGATAANIYYSGIVGTSSAISLISGYSNIGMYWQTAGY